MPKLTPSLSEFFSFFINVIYKFVYSEHGVKLNKLDWFSIHFFRMNCNVKEFQVSFSEMLCIHMYTYNLEIQILNNIKKILLPGPILGYMDDPSAWRQDNALTVMYSPLSSQTEKATAVGYQLSAKTL